MPADKEDNGELLPAELMARVRQIQIRTHRMMDDVLSGAYRSTFRGTGIEFEEVRPYQPGDEVRSIDWNRTARSGAAFVKTYVEERELTLNLLVDTSRSMDFGSRAHTKRETAASLCALLAFVAVHQQDQIGLTLFGDRAGLHLPPRKGMSHVARVVREVIAARPTGGGTSFAEVLEHQARTLRRRSLIFLVSDFVEPEGADESYGWGDHLARLARRHDVVAVRIGDPFEEELPKAGWIRLRDLESGREVEVDTRSASVREAWARAAADRRAHLREVLERARVDLVEISTEGDVADPLVRFFKSRRRGRGGSR